MTLQEIVDQSMDKFKTFNLNPVMPALRFANEGAMNDVLNTNGCAYYQWLPGLIEVVKPKQIVELGGAMGVSSIMMLNSQYQDFDLYSITLPEGGLEFSYVKDTYSNFHPILGDDLDVSNFSRVDLSQTDIWFFDALHTFDHLSSELALYSPFFKKGAILLFDDIRSFGLWPVWESLPYEKIELTDPCHYSGFGIARV